MGNEAWGLEKATLAACDEVVRVPIHGHAESLNLAMAATVCMYASAAASADQRIATFDLGSLDTLDALGVSEQVVGVPQASLPSYLEQYAADRYTDIGGLRSPNMEALAEANPTLIVHTGRQAEWADALGEIARFVVTRAA